MGQGNTAKALASRADLPFIWGRAKGYERLIVRGGSTFPRILANRHSLKGLLILRLWRISPIVNGRVGWKFQALPTKLGHHTSENSIDLGKFQVLTGF